MIEASFQAQCDRCGRRSRRYGSRSTLTDYLLIDGWTGDGVTEREGECLCPACIATKEQNPDR